MIVTEQARESRAVQNPAYRLIRQLQWFLLLPLLVLELHNVAFHELLRADVILEELSTEVFWIGHHIQARQ